MYQYISHVIFQSILSTNIDLCGDFTTQGSSYVEKHSALIRRYFRHKMKQCPTWLSCRLQFTSGRNSGETKYLILHPLLQISPSYPVCPYFLMYISISSKSVYSMLYTQIIQCPILPAVFYRQYSSNIIIFSTGNSAYYRSYTRLY